MWLSQNFPKDDVVSAEYNTGNDIWEYLTKNLTMHAKGYKHTL